MIRITGNGWDGKQEEVEVPKTQDKIDREWMEMLAEETRKREVAQLNLVTFGEEMDRMEVKWEAKLEDTNKEIVRLQQQLKTIRKPLCKEGY